MATPTISSGPTQTSPIATPSCTTEAPGRYGHVSIDACNSNYGFDPSFSGNLAFAVLFGLSCTAHVVEAFAFRKKYCWVVIMGALWETVAFIIRTLGAHDQQQLQYAIWGQILFLLAPLWVNAFAYMTVARMIHFGLPEKKIWGIPAIKLTQIFIWLDVVCFFVQLVGAGMLSNNDDHNITSIGMKVYMAGIGIQLGFIVIFAAMTAFFYYKMHQISIPSMGRMQYLIWAMLAVLTLVTMRIIYRLVEFGPGVGSDNPILTHEGYPFGLDAFPMVLALFILNVVHPGFVLKGPNSDFPHMSRAEKKALKKERKAEKQRRKQEKKLGIQPVVEGPCNNQDIADTISLDSRLNYTDMQGREPELEAQWHDQRQYDQYPPQRNADGTRTYGYAVSLQSR